MPLCSSKQIVTCSSLSVNASQIPHRGCVFATAPSYLESTGVGVRDSSVGIATCYRLGGPGSNPGVGEIFRTRPNRPCGPPSLLYRGADKFLARPGRKQARKHVRDARDFNNIETRAVIKFFSPLQGKAPKEIHAILIETLACLLSGRTKDLSAPLSLCIFFVLFGCSTAK